MRGVLDKDLVQLDIERKDYGVAQSTCNSNYSTYVLGRRLLIYPDEYNEDIDCWQGSMGLRFEKSAIMLGME